MHEEGILHCDIKPDNLLMGRPGSATARNVYAIDFGLCQSWVNPKGEHVAANQRWAPAGTPSFMSIPTHRRQRPSRRDDIESLSYVLVFLALGKLPWFTNAIMAGPNKMRVILAIKQATPAAKLCEGLPAEFATIVDYARNLKFSEEPQYGFLEDLFQGALTRAGRSLDQPYD